MSPNALFLTASSVLLHLLPRPPQISSSYHKKTVYTLAWGPPVPPVSFGKFPLRRAGDDLFDSAAWHRSQRRDLFKLPIMLFYMLL